MDTHPTVTADRFAQGMPLRQYSEGMTQNREMYEERYRNFALSEQSARRLQSMQCEINVLVIAEDWCGDVLRYVPVLERMSEAAPSWNVRAFYRDRNPDLSSRWLKRGVHRAIPVIVFFDQQMREIGHFIEKPALVYSADAQARETFAERYPDLPDAHLHSSEMSPETYNLYVAFIGEHRATNLARWQQIFVDEILTLLSTVECEAA